MMDEPPLPPVEGKGEGGPEDGLIP